MNASPKRFYEFGPFRIDTVKRLLLRDGAPVALKSKCFETLLALVEAGGQVLEKDELMRRIWPDTICDCQPQGGRELGMDRMVKRTESPLTRRYRKSSVRGCYAVTKRWVVGMQVQNYCIVGIYNHRRLGET